MIEATEKIHVMFVCMGNICRSPTAHAVMQDILKQKGVSDQFVIESSGTHAYHVGEPADERTQKIALSKGIDMSDLRAQKISITDYDRFDWILAMDHDNLELIDYYSPESPKAQIRLLMDFPTHENYQQQSIVPDPYYGGEQGFEEVFSMLEDACAGFLEYVMQSK